MPPPQGSFNPLEGPGDYTTTKLVHSDTYPAIDPSTTADFSGKSVLIVGASKGIGKSIALSFAKAGASFIALAARSDLSAIENEVRQAARDPQSVQVTSVKLDIVEEESNAAAAEKVEEWLGGKGLDVLVNNAGVLEGLAPVKDCQPDLWWRNITVNLKGPYLTSRAFLPLLLKSTQKTLINISSVGAHCITPGGSAYQTSKLAVLRFTEFLAVEYKDAGLIAFAVHPGNILTDIVGRGEGMSEDFKAVFTETTELCADSLVFLSKERREWLSGRYVNCTWDLPELVSDEKREEIVRRDMLKVRSVV